MNKEKLNISEINNIKADYCLGNLLSEDTSRFEKSIVDYPDIQNEILEIKMNLSQVDATKFNEYMERKARNVSVNVQERLSSKSSKINLFMKSYLVTATAMSVFILLFFLLTNDRNQNSLQDYTNHETIENTIMNIIEEELNYEQELLNIKKDYSLKDHLFGFDDSAFNDSGIESDDILYDEIIDFTNISEIQLNYLLTDNSLSYVFKDIINEDYFDYILEEIENETFN